jgi:hypothetical protein
MNTGTSYSVLLGIYPEAEMLDLMVDNIVLFPQSLHYFTVPKKVHKGSNFSISSPALAIFPGKAE